MTGRGAGGVGAASSAGCRGGGFARCAAAGKNGRRIHAFPGLFRRRPRLDLRRRKGARAAAPAENPQNPARKFRKRNEMLRLRNFSFRFCLCNPLKSLACEIRDFAVFNDFKALGPFYFAAFFFANRFRRQAVRRAGRRTNFKQRKLKVPSFSIFRKKYGHSRTPFLGRETRSGPSPRKACRLRGRWRAFGLAGGEYRNPWRPRGTAGCDPRRTFAPLVPMGWSGRNGSAAFSLRFCLSGPSVSMIAGPV